MCEYCEKEIYIKVPKVIKSVIAPVTPTAQIIDEIEDKLGFQFIKIEKQNYCPMCGRKLGGSNE